MRAWAKVCALLLALVLAMAIAAAGAERKKCPAGQRACQYGEDDYICIDVDRECPKPIALPRSLCPDGKKACQVDDDQYVCIDLDDTCP